MTKTYEKVHTGSQQKFIFMLSIHMYKTKPASHYDKHRTRNYLTQAKLNDLCMQYYIIVFRRFMLITYSNLCGFIIVNTAMLQMHYFQ